MDPDSWILGGLLALSFLLAAFSAAAEIALASVNRLQWRQMLAAGQNRAQTAEVLLGEPARLLSTLIVLRILSYVTAAATVTLLSLRIWGTPAVAWSLIVVTLLLAFSQIFARGWAVGRQERIGLTLSPIVRFLSILLSPITGMMLRIGQKMTPSGASVENIFLSEGGLRFLLSASDEETMIEDEEKEMIASIFEFGETLVREVMVPRIDVVAIALETPMLEAADVMLKAGHSRVPVYNDTIDNIAGILYAKDLLRYLRDGRTDVPLGKILRPAYYIPESKKVDELLQELQQRKVHMAVVVDEYGGTAGIVTIEDLLEEIVGEIQDEYDIEQVTIEAVSENEYLFDARVDLDEVDKLLMAGLPHEGGDTLGGFIYSQLGKVPAVGDTIEFNGASFEVLSVAGRRIKQVRARRTEPLVETRNGNGSTYTLSLFI